MPTPASLHNYLQTSLEPGLNNGVVLKGITRSKINGGYFGDITVDGPDGNGHRYGFHGSLPFVLRS